MNLQFKELIHLDCSFDRSPIRKYEDFNMTYKQTEILTERVNYLIENEIEIKVKELYDYVKKMTNHEITDKRIFREHVQSLLQA
ncbi:MAG: hypothetical protein VCB24_00600 [Pseudomonas sp.]|uniref:hypothetical protein n=1 Tax=Pseudomonas sp. TaxID=306 RepID=UPI003981DA09